MDAGEQKSAGLESTQAHRLLLLRYTPADKVMGSDVMASLTLTLGIIGSTYWFSFTDSADW